MCLRSGAIRQYRPTIITRKPPLTRKQSIHLLPAALYCFTTLSRTRVGVKRGGGFKQQFKTFKKYVENWVASVNRIFYILREGLILKDFTMLLFSLEEDDEFQTLVAIGALRYS